MIHVRVQAHPARRHLIPRLVPHFRYPSETVVLEHSSDPPDPWSGYLNCLVDLPVVEHVLIVQDDAIPVPGFWDALESIAVASTPHPVCLWMGALPANAAARARRAYGKKTLIPLGPASFVPLVAVLWPYACAIDLWEWAQTAAQLTRADDGNVARWARQTKTEIMVAVPSIVEHDDFTPTVKGGRPETMGRDRSRVALLLAEDARLHQW